MTTLAELRVPLIEEDDVRMALKALRQAEPYPRAFWQLVWIHQWVEARRLGSVSVEGDVALGNALVHMIETNLQAMRRTMGLLYDLPQERQAALDRYKQDFSQENVELEAWSALYYRYVRFDLDLSLDKMADELGISARNLRRRIYHGIRRLTEAISQQEAEARAAHWRLWLKLKLPPPTHSQLFGVDETVGGLQRMLVNSPPYLVGLIGPGGAGKTSLAYEAAQWSIDEEIFADLAWLTLKSTTTYAALLSELARGLGYLHLAGLGLEDMEAGLRMRFASRETLVVLDGIDRLVDPAGVLAQLVKLIPPGRVLLTCRHRPSSGVPIRYIEVPALNRDAIAALLDDIANRQKRGAAGKLTDSVVDAIYEAVGGNPYAAQVIVGQLAFLPVEQVLNGLAGLPAEGGVPLFDWLFSPTWRALSEAARQVAVALTLLPGDEVSWQLLHDTARLPPERFNEALAELVNGSLVEVSGEPLRYTLPPLARQFVEMQSRRPPLDGVYRKLWQAAVEREQPELDRPGEAAANVERVLALLNSIQLGADAHRLTELVRRAAPSVRRRGQWAAWRDALTHLQKHIAGSESGSAMFSSIYFELGTAHRWLGELDSAEEMLRQAAWGFGTLGDFIAQAQALLELGQVYQIIGQTELAYEAYQRAAASAQRYAARDIYRQALNRLAGLALQNDRPAEARMMLERVLDGEPDGQTLSNLGMAYSELGEEDRAIDCALQAVELFRQEGDLPAEARAHLRLGITCYRAGRLGDALGHLRDAQSLMRALGDALGSTVCLNNLGVVYGDLGFLDEALRTWRAALQLQLQLDDHINMAYTWYNLADLHWRRAEEAQAQAALIESYSLAERWALTALLARIEQHPANRA